MTADPAELADRVRSARFVPVRLKVGYDMATVDDLLDDVVDALGTRRPIRPLVEAARFPTTRFREGYQLQDVDDFLAQLVADAGEGLLTRPERG